MVGFWSPTVHLWGSHGPGVRTEGSLQGTPSVPTVRPSSHWEPECSAHQVTMGRTRAQGQPSMTPEGSPSLNFAFLSSSWSEQARIHNDVPSMTSLQQTHDKLRHSENYSLNRFLVLHLEYLLTSRNGCWAALS